MALQRSSKGASEGAGERGEELAGPPWILGHRGAPREAPENTLSALRRALEYGLDGVEYDLHACKSGEAVLLHDDTLDRTTNATGPVAERTLPELFGIDAGGWFHARYEGEPLPLLDEALDLPGNDPARAPMHMIEIKEPALVAEVARRLRGVGRRVFARLASFDRGACLEARDAGLASMLLAERASEDDRRFVRDERLAAYGVGPGGWRTAAGAAEWSCERWGWSHDEPADLLDAVRLPLFGFNTNEPLRALSVRALARLAPAYRGAYPLDAPELEVEPGALSSGSGEWCGRWQVQVLVRNPFPFAVRAELELAPRGGAYEAEGLPARLELGPGEEHAVALALAGGSWSPGSDPLVLVRFRFGAAPGRPAGKLVLDAPLHRVRTTTAGESARRLVLLKERRGDRDASVTVRRRQQELLVEIEDAGGLQHPRLAVRLGSTVHRGGRGLRLWLPEGFDREPVGVPFSCAIEGRTPGAAAGAPLVIRRWAGGLPEGLESGVPGRLRAQARS